MKDKEPRSNPELEACLIEAHVKGAPIKDLDYDEVSGFLDVVLASAKKATEEGTSKVRQVAEQIRVSSSTGLRRSA